MTDQDEEFLRKFFNKDIVIKEFTENYERLPKHPFLKNIPTDILVCLIEANMCFVISAYNAAMVLSWMALECHLRMHLAMKEVETSGQRAVDLLNISGKSGLLTREQVGELHRLRRIRNTIIHSSFFGVASFGISNERGGSSNQGLISSALKLYKMVDVILHSYYSKQKN